MLNNSNVIPNISREFLIKRAEERIPKQIYNETGLQVDINTFTAIKAEVTTQKFYQVPVPISSYVPIVIGENAYADDILTWRSFSPATDFERYIIDPSTANGKFQTASAQLDSIKIPTRFFGAEITYNIIELQKASLNRNWSLVSGLEQSRFLSWKLGIQQTAFIGIPSVPDMVGLLSSPEVSINTTTITQSIKSMNENQFQVLLENLISDYYSNNNSTAYPNRFVIPTSDYNGLGVSTSEQFPLKSKLKRLRETFSEIVIGEEVMILPSVFCEPGQNPATSDTRYALYRHDTQSMRMDIPVDYLTLAYDTVKGFNYESVAIGQFSGVGFYRPQETLYFDFS